MEVLLTTFLREYPYPFHSASFNEFWATDTDGRSVERRKIITKRKVENDDRLNPFLVLLINEPVIRLLL